MQYTYQYLSIRIIKYFKVIEQSKLLKREFHFLTRTNYLDLVGHIAAQNLLRITENLGRRLLCSAI